MAGALTFTFSADALPDLPEARCIPVVRALEESGFPDPRDWEDAPKLYLHDAVTGNPGTFQTTVQTLYDERFFYVRFLCEDDSIFGTFTERDSPIWNEECVEIFINPTGSQHQYYEINVSPANVIYDSVILNNRTPERPGSNFIGLPEWSPARLKTEVNVTGEWNTPGAGEYWEALFAIPHRALLGAPNQPPSPGDRWRINFYRIDRASPDSKGESYAWSTTGSTAFHLPWRFGTIVFAAGPGPASDTVHP